MGAIESDIPPVRSWTSSNPTPSNPVIVLEPSSSTGLTIPTGPTSRPRSFEVSLYCNCDIFKYMFNSVNVYGNGTNMNNFTGR